MEKLTLKVKRAVLDDAYKEWPYFPLDLQDPSLREE